MGAGWSWSTAYADVRAFTILGELILVPFSSWDEQGNFDDQAYQTALGRGLIEQDFGMSPEPHRAIQKDLSSARTKQSNDLPSHYRQVPRRIVHRAASVLRLRRLRFQYRQVRKRRQLDPGILISQSLNSSQPPH